MKMHNHTDPASASGRFAELLEHHGFDAASTFAAESKIPRTTVNGWLSHESRMRGAKAENLYSAAKTLGVPTGILGYLFTGQFEQSAAQPDSNAIRISLGIQNASERYAPTVNQDILRQALRSTLVRVARSGQECDIDLISGVVAELYETLESSCEAA